MATTIASSRELNCLGSTDICATMYILQWKVLIEAGLLIFCGKKRKILRDFQGQIRGKIGRFRGIFTGKKWKFAQKSADFVGFLQEKSQNLQKNQPISRDFSGKKSNFEGFSGQILRKIGRFHEKFLGQLRQETISKKQPILLDFFGKFHLNRSILRRYDQHCLTLFFNRDNHLLFQQPFAREISEC